MGGSTYLLLRKKRQYFLVKIRGLMGKFNKKGQPKISSPRNLELRYYVFMRKGKNFFKVR
jgi:hypothetical protein